MRFTLIAIALGGCFYAPGSYASLAAPFVGVREPTGCLDLAVARGSDAVATAGPVVAYAFGNHCYHQTVVDFTRVVAFAVDAGGAHHPMRPSDPRRELRAMSLDALWKGDEQVMYTTVDGTAADTICLDVGHLDREASGEPRVVCLGAAL